MVRLVSTTRVKRFILKLIIIATIVEPICYLHMLRLLKTDRKDSAVETAIIQCYAAEERSSHVGGSCDRFVNVDLSILKNWHISLTVGSLQPHQEVSVVFYERMSLKVFVSEVLMAVICLPMIDPWVGWQPMSEVIYR